MPIIPLVSPGTQTLAFPLKPQTLRPSLYPAFIGAGQEGPEAAARLTDAGATWQAVWLAERLVGLHEPTTGRLSD